MRLPSDIEFADLVGPMLSQPLAAPVSLTVSNLPAVVMGMGSSAALAGQLSQGVYGDEQAVVWVFWGRQDGGTARVNWENGRIVGVNTNFNTTTFRTTVEGLTAQTNYYFRFYATNASGEVWAPAYHL